MTRWKNRALQVPYFVPYKALENFFKVLYGTTGGTCSAQFFRPVIKKEILKANKRLKNTTAPGIDNITA